MRDAVEVTRAANAAEEDKKIKAAIATTRAIADCIRDLGSVPAGHLYARLMDRMTLDNFEFFVSVLVKGGVVRRDPSHLLTWIGK